MPLTARVICARLVRESASFLVHDLARTDRPRMYHLRESGLKVAIRHARQDGATLAEVFYRGDYRPPAEVLAALGEPQAILDLGGNIGLFGAFAAPRWPKAQMTAYEPDPDNADVLARTVAANALGGRWRLVRAAAGATDRDVDLAAGRAMESFIPAPGEDPAGATIRVPMRDVLAEMAAADLVKIDIEGGEWEILLDPRFLADPPRTLVLEYHPHLCPGPDPRAEAEHALAAAGMQISAIWHRNDGYGMLWAWRAPGGMLPHEAR
jgi:FkbM family methyltransferase